MSEEELRLTKDEIREMARDFLRYVQYEEELREELLLLKLAGRLDEVKEALKRHDELIAEIERNRRENILPIIEKLMKFVSLNSKREA